MAYDFNISPLIQGLLDTRRQLEAQAAADEQKPLLSLLSTPAQPAPVEQSQQQSSPQPQEPLDGKQMIDVSMANALDIPQAPNSYALNVQRGLLTQKQAYADAKTDAEKAKAHSTAEILRNKANAAGIDVSGYGSDVSLGDAVNNLASQEARDIMGAFQGYYSRDSGQYYNDKYIEGLMRGYSPRQSRKVAEALTGSYKADRVQYLDGLLNSYGRADTALANQILASMIPEAPALAQFYTLTNPTPLNEYNTAVDVAKEAAKQSNALQLLGETFKNRLGEIEAQTAGNIALENVQSANTLKRDAQKQKYTKENARDQYGYQWNLNEQQGKLESALASLRGRIERDNLEYLERFKSNLKYEEFQKKVATYEVFADSYLGLKGDAAKSFVVSALGIKPPDPNTGKFDKASIDNAKKVHDALDASEKNILDQIKNAGMDLDPKTAQELNAKLEQIRISKQNLINQMGDQLGGGQMYSNFDEGSDEAAEQRNIASVAAILQIGAQAGASEEQQFAAVRKWVPPDRTDTYVQALIRKARGG